MAASGARPPRRRAAAQWLWLRVWRALGLRGVPGSGQRRALSGSAAVHVGVAVALPPLLLTAAAVSVGSRPRTALALTAAAALLRLAPGSTVTPRALTLQALGLVLLARSVHDLSRLGWLLVALPGVSYQSSCRVARFRALQMRRSVRPDLVVVGAAADVTLELTNTGRRPVPPMVLVDRCAAVAGGVVRTRLPAMPPGAGSRAAYQITPPGRGRYPVGPVSLVRQDPFGLVAESVGFPGTTLTVLAVPAVQPLPTVPLGSRRGSGTDGSGAATVTGEDAVGVRDYRRGDDLRRVHWRSTARTGELMVRTEEQPRQARAVLLLDTRASAHRGQGTDASFEFAVSAAAAIAGHLTGRGFALTYLATGAAAPLGGVSGALAMREVLTDLATTRTAVGASLPEAVGALAGGVPGVPGRALDAVWVAVLGSADSAGVSDLARAGAAGGGVAVIVDSAGWTQLSPAGRGAADEQLALTRAELLGAGWRTVVAGRGDDLAARWQQLSGARTARFAASAGTLRSAAGRR